MTHYPFYQLLQNESQNMANGNFGLWYNKFIPLSNAFKASDDRGNDTRAAEFYNERYGRPGKIDTAALLKQKHEYQQQYCAIFHSETYEAIQIEATLSSPLITGIGESHPNEISMVFDHNLGIPYIPASGVKGIVRFAHTLSLIPQAEEKGLIDEKGRFDDEADWTFVANMFGVQKRKGQVIFFDAYPQSVPQLHIDIMNPHYAPYYSDGKPPADHHNPTPIKFLTVAQGTAFIFRAIVKKENDLPQKVRAAIGNALTEEGIGAKTAVGYGRFDIRNDEQVASAKQPTTAAKPSTPPPPAEEVWENATVSYDAGGAGKITAQAQGKPHALLQGAGNRANLRAAVAEAQHKNLFEKKKPVKARITVRKAGNAWEIVKVEPAA